MPSLVQLDGPECRRVAHGPTAGRVKRAETEGTEVLLQVGRGSSWGDDQRPADAVELISLLAPTPAPRLYVPVGRLAGRPLDELLALKFRHRPEVDEVLQREVPGRVSEFKRQSCHDSSRCLLTR